MGQHVAQTGEECSHVLELFSEYLDRELPPGSCEELEKHLSGCQQCQEFVRSIKRNQRLCHEAGETRKPPPISPELKAELRAAYEQMLERRRGAAV